MTELNEPTSSARRNPLIWIVLIVVGLILFVVLSGERGDVPQTLKIDQTSIALSGAATQADVASDTDNLSGMDDSTSVDSAIITNDTNPTMDSAGAIERSLLVPPGMRARQYIAKLRAAGKPYPLSEVFEKAQQYRGEGSLADAHLLYFFAAREDHLAAMMTMGEMSDPVLFRAEDSLLDQADAIQAYKWYSKAAELGQPNASQRLDGLDRWANEAAAKGNAEASQLLLNTNR
jgi:TPR repeat protein